MSFQYMWLLISIADRRCADGNNILTAVRAWKIKNRLCAYRRAGLFIGCVAQNGCRRAGGTL